MSLSVLQPLTNSIKEKKNIRKKNQNKRNNNIQSTTQIQGSCKQIASTTSKENTHRSCF